MKLKRTFYPGLQSCFSRLALTLLVLIASSDLLKAQFDGGLESVTYARLTGHVAGTNTSPLTVGATAPLTYGFQNEQSKKIKNIITLNIIEETPFYLGTDFSATVGITIQYGSSPLSYFSQPQNLTVTWNKNEGVKYNARNYFSFNDAEYVNIIVNSITFTPSNIGINFPEDILMLTNEMRVTRYYELQPGITLPSFSSLTANNPIDEFNVTWPAWPATAGNNGTQLEWTWLENELESNYYIPNTTTVDIEKLFRNNSTRVDLGYDVLSYKIPLFYDGDGKLYYRVRAVNFHSSGTRADGAWSTPGTISYTGHNNDLNWQVRTTFAEEGNRKTVMEYFDGSFRSRQSVSKENVGNTTITAETFYDFEGRPAIQILPAPGINTIIQYQANLNRFNSQALNQNPAEIFDLQPIASTSSLTEPLLNTTGTSKYYSSNNDEINIGPNKNIPNAEGYPYTVVRYTPDGTGRIMAQSGVGPAHKMSSGRETKYYYGTPAQEELDGLFGTEVGNYTHYFKNMVKDANGQMSVSYSDMYGRTIATALAGDAPSNLLALDINNPANYPNQSGTTINRNLLNPATNIVKNNSIEAINTILVTAPNTTYYFEYSLAPDKLQLNSCTNTPLCYDCLYDLEISITDDNDENPPIVWKFTNVSLSPDDNCNTSTPPFTWVSGPPVSISGNNILFQTLLQPGSYAVRKTLTLSESSFQHYKTLFLTTGKGICKTEQEIIDSVYNVLQSSYGCDLNPSPGCTTCLNDLGPYNTFRSNWLATIGNPNPVPSSVENEIQAAYNTALQLCNNICNTNSQLLGSKRQLMLADMMPYGGQYALETGSGTMYDKYNIFQSTSGSQPFYQHPLNANQQPDYYRTDNGDIDESIHPGGSGYTLLNSTTKAEFAQQFTNSWANALLPHHPEYNRLVYAETNLTGSYNWINTFLGTPTYLDAQNAGYIMTSNATLIDPFYIVAPGKKSEMEIWVTSNYAGSNLSLWQIARGDVLCKNIMDLSSRQWCYNTYGSGIKFPPFSDITTTAQKDQMWKAFRNLYASARDYQVNEFIKTTVSLGDESALVAQGYQLRFANNQQLSQQSGWTWLPPAPGNPPVLPPGFPGGSAGATYQTRCESYIPQWKNQLLQCTVLAGLPQATRDAILDEITAGMVSVCVNGSDAANPEGSSTVKPSYAGTPRSFEEVINQAYLNHGINPPKDYLCNPYIIEFPKPYGKNPSFFQEYTSVVDSCACAHWDSLRIRILNAGGNPNQILSVNNYLVTQNMDTLTPVLHQALLGCSGYREWVCDTIQQLTTVFCYDPAPCTIDCAQRATKSPDGELPDEPTTCEDWTYFLNCFIENSGAINTGSSNCEEVFEQWYQSTFGIYRPWAWLASAYQSSCGQTLNVCITCTTQVYCTVETNCRWQFRPYVLNTPQPLPDYLKCGGWPPKGKCLTCDTLQALTAEFKLIFVPPYNAGPHFTGTNLTPDQIEQNILYARFLNFRTGFQYSWMQYAQAAATANCNALGGGGGVVDLVVTTRTGNTPQQYIASNSITFDPNFDHPAGDDYETLLQPNGGGGGSQTIICRGRNLTDTTGIFIIDTPCHRIHVMAIELGQTIYQQQQQTLLANFEAAYRAKCMAAKDIESFTVSYTCKEYHYTLYYYDQAGSLVKTVPPKGVHPDYSLTFLNSVKVARNNCMGSETDPCIRVAPPHDFVTNYRYNNLDQVVQQNCPDANTSKFWYDKLGRLVVSQNAQQALENKYTYILFDALGRIVEVGQKPHTTPMTQEISEDRHPTISLNTWITTNNFGGGYREQITITGYDAEFEPNRRPLIHQQNLRNRVSYTAFRNAENDPQPPPYYTGTLYTYDIHGNVDTMLQDYSGIPEMSSTSNTFKRVTYRYDLISGKTKMVSYQPGEWDAFYQKYEYDLEKRLKEAWTSRDNIYWERDASYNYYKHGNLARTVFGQQQVQGIDYAYTIQGWLKGVNGTNAPTGETGVYDIGEDGMSGGANSNVAKDVYGFGLHFFDDGLNVDYLGIGTGMPYFAEPNNPAFVSLYNGNIGAMSVNLGPFSNKPNPTNNELPLFYNYRYDQLHRIRSTDVYWGLGYVGRNANRWIPQLLTDYKEAVTYDPNGNILTYLRNGSPSVPGKLPQMDDLTYNYIAGKNQLRQVTDNPSYTGHYTDDIDNQTNPNNYTYDAIGNLKSDASENITNIEWNVNGKIKLIEKNNIDIIYSYDAAGSRITKTVGGKTTIYVRDGGGRVLSIYEKPVSGSIEQLETHLYGGSRIGISSKQTIAVSTVLLSGTFGVASNSVYTRGEKRYELVNHLGNVLVTVSDKKIQVSAGSVVDYYKSDVISAVDFYTGGMELPGRGYQTDMYRYSINGQEKTPEIGNNTTTAEFWQYDARIIRRWNIDPVLKEYESPYMAFSGNPVLLSDPNGDTSGGDEDGPSKGTPRMRRALKWAKKKYGDKADVYYKDGKLILRAKFAYALNPVQIPAYTYVDENFNTVKSHEGVTVVGGEQEFELSEEYLKDNFSTWSKIKGAVSTALDFVPVVGNIKGAIEGIVGYDLAGNKLEPWERAIGLAGPFAKVAKKGYKLFKTLDNAEDVASIARGVDKAQDAAKAVDKTVDLAEDANSTYKSLTSSNYRHNLQVLTGKAGEGMDAHHIFPQAKRFQKHWEKAGINIHDPENMVWWELRSHRSAAKEYNKAWDAFFKKYGDDVTADQIRNFGEKLKNYYGL